MRQRIKFHGRPPFASARQLVASLAPTPELLEFYCANVMAVTVSRLQISKAIHVKAVLRNLRSAGWMDAKARFDRCRGN